MSNESTLHTRGRRIDHRRISVSQGVEGPEHDPYSWSAIRWQGADFGVGLKQSALGYIRVSVFNGDGKEIWHEQGNDDEALRLNYINGIFERMSGVPFAYACAVIHARENNALNYDCDPMGRITDYI